MTDHRPIQPAVPLLPQVWDGETADVYFLRSRDVLSAKGLNPSVGMTVFPRLGGVYCGLGQVVELFQGSGFDGELWSLPEGEPVAPGETALQIRGRYDRFGIYETALLGILASCTAWATTANEVVAAAAGVPVISFGARHVHPNVAGVMDYCAIVGGCVACSTPLGAALTGTAAAGTMPHAYVLVMQDTVEAAVAFDETMPDGVPRIVLVDTFQDEVVESIRVGQALGSRLQGVRLDTPHERGGVTPELVIELRSRLDLAGLNHVQITVSGGMSPDRIRHFIELDTPVDSFGVGSYISGARPIDYTADIREIDGKAVSKRGRIPGMPHNERLQRVL